MMFSESVRMNKRSDETCRFRVAAMRDSRRQFGKTALFLLASSSWLLLASLATSCSFLSAPLARSRLVQLSGRSSSPVVSLLDSDSYSESESSPLAGAATFTAGVAAMASAALAVAAFATRRPVQRRLVGSPCLSANGASRRLITLAAVPSTHVETLDMKGIRADFPALNQDAKPGIPLIYLDNAATSQKPRQVLEEMTRFYSEDNSNVHRGMHALSIRATEAFEGARSKVASFINAAGPEEIVFTRNATEGVNLVARTWGSANLRPGDEILLTVMEHHSNLVPWQLLAQASGATLRFAGVTANGTLDTESFESLLGPKTRLVAMCHVSNVLGCVNPIEWVAERAHAVGAKLLVDACQSVPHMPVDVQKLGADWLVASSHKMCGPTGIGFLWGRAEVLRASPPFLGGGEMINEVSLETSTYNDIPHKFEAGTPAYAEAVALGAACDYLSTLGMDKIAEREHALTEHLWRSVRELPGIVTYGPTPAEQPNRASLVCFTVEGCHANDLATLVDQERGVAMRSGHHCTQPLHKQLGIPASARLSAYFYNTFEEIDVAVGALKDAINLVRGDPSTDEAFALDPAMAAALADL
ncbi:unnamed protein product [Polarella glacialis]|uniref:cysteine desulfurase n=1 Tax=Polarella glacialis TaxID=89957 RepID=A0A813IKN3_POLGL|nr:unnamed protein product [Polarella glacialis]